MTDKTLADIRRVLGNAAAAGAARPRMVLYVEAGEVMAYLQADAEAPGETWTTTTLPLPSAAAWPEFLDELTAGDHLKMLLEDPHEYEEADKEEEGSGS